MAVAFEVEERIARPPEVVWRHLTDWKRAPGWMAGIDTLDADGPTAVGTTLAFQARGKGRSSEISALREGREITLTSHQGPVSAHYTYACSADGDGTHVRLVADCRIRGPLRLLGPLLRLAIRRTDAGQLRALKAVVEAAPTSS